MARSNKPIFWGLFAAGGTVAAFVLPVMVLFTMKAGYGSIPEAMSYETMHAFAANWFGKLFLLAVIALCLWHAAHRIRTALYGLGLRADKTVAFFGYSIAGVGTFLTIVYLLQI